MATSARRAWLSLKVVRLKVLMKSVMMAHQTAQEEAADVSLVEDG